MNKRKILLGVLMASLVALLFVTGTNAKAAKIRAVNTIPSRYIGKWYSYNNGKMLFTKKSVNGYQLHSYRDAKKVPNKVSNSYANKTKDWVFATTVTKKIHGHRYQVLYINEWPSTGFSYKTSEKQSQNAGYIANQFTIPGHGKHMILNVGGEQKTTKNKTQFDVSGRYGKTHAVGQLLKHRNQPLITNLKTGSAEFY